MFDNLLSQPFPARRVLVGISGSIAAATLPTSVMVMRHMLGLDVRVVLTRQAATFVAPRALAAVSGRPALVDGDYPAWDVAAPHIELTRWADVLLVMPATAGMLARAAHGIADDLVSTCIAAAPCPVVFVPAMNDMMWFKPAVQRNVATLIADGYHVIPPAEGMAAADGQVGMGAMPDMLTVLRETSEILAGRGSHDTAPGVGPACTTRTHGHAQVRPYVETPSEVCP
jgi:phosphopantothenoylcysteine synthetase/decarboxylase